MNQLSTIMIVLAPSSRVVIGCPSPLAPEDISIHLRRYLSLSTLDQIHYQVSVIRHIRTIGVLSVVE
jgi:hypothetical protein